jgi:adenine-specific DNA-methyltransferase
MDGQSLNITQDIINKLKDIMPQVFSEEKIDFDKLKTVLGEHLYTGDERYQLSWAGKADAYKVLQKPTTSTLIPHPEESINWDETENVFIEGENLEVLKILQKAYYGKIKMIYIDPPYNTGSDSFIYPDKFSETKDEYLKRTGDKDEEGYLTREGLFRTNSKENGQYHSNWLNMMLPRLFLARNLLRDDGVIFVSIDDNEQANLKLLCDEIFGEENFISSFIWKKRVTRENRAIVSVNHEYILCYSKSSENLGESISLLPMNDAAKSRYKNPDQDERGVWTSVPAIAQAGHGTKNQFYTLITPSGRKIDPPSGSCWRYTKEKMAKEIKDNRIWFGSDGNGVPRIKKFLTEGRQGLTPETILSGKEIGTTDSAKRDLVSLFDGLSVFDTPKPKTLMKHLIDIGVIDKNEIILDFFSGTSPIAESVLDYNANSEYNLSFICVQLPELTDTKSEAYKAGFKSISEISESRMKKVIEKIETERKSELPLDKPTIMGFRKFSLSDSNFKIWRGDLINSEEELQKQVELFSKPQRDGAEIENMLWELLIKNGVPLTEKVQMIELGDKGSIYHTENSQYAFVLEKYNEDVQKKVLELAPKVVICLDTLFKGNDNVKTNAQLKFEDNGISFKTV